MMFRGFQNPSNPWHWGYVFWSLCVLTTIIAVVLAVTIHPRTWCAFCPIGTLQNLIGGGKGQLLIDEEACKECHLCEKVCALNLSKAAKKETGYLPDRDCLKCSECITVCPNNALKWP
jgi:polyferredoxin